jgi:DNA-directed RNA polymerase alpha subunit
MPSIQATVWLPAELWKAVEMLAADEGDANTVVLRAVEEYVTATRKRRGRQRPGKYQRLAKALSMPVFALHLSARPAAALRTLNIRYVYELAQKSPTDLFCLSNFGEKSLREVKEKLANLGLMLGMTLEDDVYRAAVLATVGANIDATRG